LFVSSTMLDHPSLHCLDDTEAVLDWTKLGSLMDVIYASKTGCPSYPLLTLMHVTANTSTSLNHIKAHTRNCYVSFKLYHGVGG
jgi:hypothetical protein